MRVAKWQLVLCCFSWFFWVENANAESSYYQTSSDYLSTDSDIPTTPAVYSEPPVLKAPQRTFIKAIPVKKTIAKSGEKTIIVNPRTHQWAAYSAQGKLIRSGIASAGASWCADLKRPCRTKAGVFRIYSLGDRGCVSKKYPLGRGGAPMPYCMYFNGGQGFHGSYQVARANLSHGCIRMTVRDARWLRFNFADIGTKVIIKSY